MRYLGIDYGTKRIGLAVSDESGMFALPHSTISTTSAALATIDSIIHAEGIEHIVLGESRNLDGELNPVQKQIEEFSNALAVLTKLPVSYEPELFTSAQAARQFEPQEKSRKQNPIQTELDASAAALILQSYLDKLKHHGH